MSQPACQMLPDLLARAARQAPQRGIALFDRRGRGIDRRTYPELLEVARRGAARWRTLRLGPGERVLVSLPNSWPWLEAWFGALFQGALPVALAPLGALAGGPAQARRIEELIGHLDARFLLCDPQFPAAAQALGAAQAQRIALPAEAFLGTAPQAGPPAVEPGRDPEATAFLQLTSGSTALPRAVMISHRAALHNPLAIGEAVAAPHPGGLASLADTVVSWLPLNHDMGLIGCLIFSIAHGLDLFLLRPDAFLLRPRLWLEQFAPGRRCLSPAPNFAYQTCVERIEESQRAGLELSPWTAAMTGAEMIRPETCAAFNQAFGPQGYRPQTFRPCYGLAEGTLAVTFDRRGEGVRTVPLPAAGAGAGFGLREVVSTGPAVLDSEVQVLAPDGAVLPEGQIGEVRARGPGLFSGYFNNPEATAESLCEGWLQTGDRGFLRGGELYLTGRSKDVLIIHGHNLMPHEIEWIAEEAAGSGGAERSAAFSVAHGSEGEVAILVLETGQREPARLQELAREIRLRVGRVLGLPLTDLVFVRRGQIPKTTSGKVQRQLIRQRYLDRQLERLG